MRKRERRLAVIYLLLGVLLCILSGVHSLQAPLVPIIGIAFIISGFCMLLRTNFWRRNHLEDGAPKTESDDEKTP